MRRRMRLRRIDGRARGTLCSRASLLCQWHGCAVGADGSPISEMTLPGNSKIATRRSALVFSYPRTTVPMMDAAASGAQRRARNCIVVSSHSLCSQTQARARSSPAARSSVTSLEVCLSRPTRWAGSSAKR